MDIKKAINTIKYLRFSQIISRIILKFKKKKDIKINKLIKINNYQLYINELHFNSKYLSRFSVQDDEINILNKKIRINFNEEYFNSLLPLYRFNLEYFEYGLFFGYKYKETKDIVYYNSFKKFYYEYINSVCKPHPYVYSLQIINIFITLELFSDVEDYEFKNIVYRRLYSEYLYIIKNQEKHLLANHYFENLKAIVIASYFFKEFEICSKYINILKKEVDEEILSDGVHFELSLMYHKVILEDLILIAKLAKNKDFPKCEWIIPVIQKMLNAACSIEKGIGRTPLFNDAGDNVAKDIETLLNTCKSEFNIEPILSDCFIESGYYKLYDKNISLLFDVGKIGPNYNPGHGHCDCLSFELSLNNIPLFVNSGTYQYQGNKRQYFRSTSSHNTLMIDNIEQSEIWAEHRVAKRILKIKCLKNDNSLVGEFINYCGDKFIRNIELDNMQLKVIDLVNSNKNGVVHSYLRISDYYELDKEYIKYNDEVIAKINPFNCGYIIKNDEDYSPEFGLIKKIKCVEFIWNVDNEKHGYTINFRKEE